MRMIVKKEEGLVGEFSFAAGQIYIGRQEDAQIVLADLAVSRQHCVLYARTDGKWIAQDLNSANKTYLNDKELDKAEIKSGDVLKITNYTIEIHFDEQKATDKQTPD